MRLCFKSFNVVCVESVFTVYELLACFITRSPYALTSNTGVNAGSATENKNTIHTRRPIARMKRPKRFGRARRADGRLIKNVLINRANQMEALPFSRSCVWPLNHSINRLGTFQRFRQNANRKEDTKPLWFFCCAINRFSSRTASGKRKCYAIPVEPTYIIICANNRTDVVRIWRVCVIAFVSVYQLITITINRTHLVTNICVEYLV